MHECRCVYQSFSLFFQIACWWLSNDHVFINTVGMKIRLYACLVSSCSTWHLNYWRSINQKSFCISAIISWTKVLWFDHIKDLNLSFGDELDLALRSYGKRRKRTDGKGWIVFELWSVPFALVWLCQMWTGLPMFSSTLHKIAVICGGGGVFGGCCFVSVFFCFSF